MGTGAGAGAGSGTGTGKGTLSGLGARACAEAAMGEAAGAVVEAVAGVMK